jgi:RNA-binding protein
MTLSTRQKQYLKGLAHPLEPTVRVGRGGVSESVAAETARTLAAHELIKVKVDAESGPKRDSLAARLASATESEVVATIGRTAILYRSRADKPKIVIPTSDE